MALNQRACSLIELVVVIAIVGVLVSIVVPAMSRARVAADNVTCLSNQRQLAAAWLTYAGDFKDLWVVNIGDAPWSNVTFGQLGVHWWGEGDIPRPIYTTPHERTLNLYLAGSALVEHDLPVVRCPSDTGAFERRTNTRPWDPSAAASLAPDRYRHLLMYAAIGTSYIINEWMYCTPGAPRGFGFGVRTKPPFFRFDQGLHSIATSPDRFVLLGDYSARTSARVEESERIARNMHSSWWHGYERTNLAFADGSVRRELTRAMFSSRYSFYLDPSRQQWPYSVIAYTW